MSFQDPFDIKWDICTHANKNFHNKQTTSSVNVVSLISTNNEAAFVSSVMLHLTVSNSIFVHLPSLQKQKNFPHLGDKWDFLFPSTQMCQPWLSRIKTNCLPFVPDRPITNLTKIMYILYSFSLKGEYVNFIFQQTM